MENLKFDGARCPFSTFLRLQGDHHWRMRTKMVSFFSTNPYFRGRTVAKPALTTLIVWSTILVTVPFIAPFTVPFFNIL